MTKKRKKKRSPLTLAQRLCRIFSHRFRPYPPTKVERCTRCLAWKAGHPPLYTGEPRP